MKTTHLPVPGDKSAYECYNTMPQANFLEVAKTLHVSKSIGFVWFVLCDKSAGRNDNCWFKYLWCVVEGGNTGVVGI